MEPLYYTAGTAVVGLIVFGAKTLIDSRVRAGVQHEFQLKIREFEHELTAMADQRQFEFQQRITDFTHLVGKRHETYAHLWELASKAHGRILEIATVSETSYEYFNESDIEAFLARRKIPAGKRQEVVITWLSSRRDGVRLLNEVVERYRIHTALEAWVRYSNYLLARELYLPDDTAVAANRLRGSLDELRVFLQDPNTRNSPEMPECRAAATRSVAVLKELLKRDIHSWRKEVETRQLFALARR